MNTEAGYWFFPIYLHFVLELRFLFCQIDYNHYSFYYVIYPKVNPRDPIENALKMSF